MMSRSMIPRNGNDIVNTPDELALQLVDAFIPNNAYCLEPCKGGGAFTRAFDKRNIKYDWAEIEEGLDFFDIKEKHYDYILSNFPYSLMRKCLIKSMELSDNVVSLQPINHLLGLKARMRDVRDMGFFVRKIICINTPRNFPSSGFQYGAIHLSKWEGDCKIEYDNREW